MREKLLSKSSLNLEQAVVYCRAAERASMQAAACRSANTEQASPALEELARGRGAPGGRGYGFGTRMRGGGMRGRGGHGGFTRATSAGRGRRESECGKCGGWHAANDTCPAYNVTCFRCERVGHFAKTCRERLIREVAIDGKDGEEYSNNEDSDEEYEDATPKSPVPRSPQGEREPGGSGIVTRSGRQVRPPQRFSFD
ncbi:uncharacterized protein LOC125242242 isoform X2 [Leguminivora glycinivorella]|uniref:uncharacterized protein LOC125228360 isoform X2 n=1 Tax=Leguminivora glycinivorella TaxID=1035111 RepID=UPI0020106B2E|nr:uncharacterized protein LOC125228360 isoform X2 [Leguminivora glycinivorella]XP_048006948.1 uncharacterized protein LOC125242242 isoform X2 [Leguminivora glycinivorella]